jgi:hypothetical protein
MDKDLTGITDWAMSQGWTVETDANSYLRFYDPRGNYIVRYPATPGNAYRRMLDLQVKLRSAGSRSPRLARKNSARHAGRKATHERRRQAVPDRGHP